MTSPVCSSHPGILIFLTASLKLDKSLRSFDRKESVIFLNPRILNNHTCTSPSGRRWSSSSPLSSSSLSCPSPPPFVSGEHVTLGLDSYMSRPLFSGPSPIYSSYRAITTSILGRSLSLLISRRTDQKKGRRTGGNEAGRVRCGRRLGSSPGSECVSNIDLFSSFVVSFSRL